MNEERGRKLSEASDHDALTRLEVQVQHIVQQQSESARQLGRVEGKVDTLSSSMTGMENRTLALERRPAPYFSNEEGADLLHEHRQMYAVFVSNTNVLTQHKEMWGFYDTFKSFIWPMLLSGPISAVIAALLTYVLVHRP